MEGIHPNISVIYGKNAKKSPYPQRRDIFPELENFMRSPIEGEARICALYGLRRTGKTEMMFQCLDCMDQESREASAYIVMTGEIGMSDLRKCMNALRREGICNFFIDEVTSANNFQACASCLSDYYAKDGCRIVIAGTDSLKIKLASYDELYDRAEFINTTHVPYAEFSRLLGGRGLDDYIMYGGTLTDKSYKTNQDRTEYINTAIVKNILHSLADGAENEKYWSNVYTMYGEAEVASVINKMINKFSYNVMLKAVNRDFKSGAMHAIIDGSKEAAFEDIVDDPAVDEGVKRALEVYDRQEMSSELTKGALDNIKGYLEELGIFKRIPRYISLQNCVRGDDMEIINQPGMVYAHSEVLMRQLAYDRNWNPNSSMEARRNFTFRADNYVKGTIMERVILLETYLAIGKSERGRFYVSQIDIAKGNREVPYEGERAEADLAVVDLDAGCSYLFEVKHSAEPVPEYQARHLLNKDFQDHVARHFAPVRSFAVIYEGPSGIERIDEGTPVQYINAEDFLTNIHELTLKIQKEPSLVDRIDFGEIAGLDPEFDLDALDENISYDE